MLRIGSALSAIMHGTLLGTVLLGWPVLDILWEREWPWLEPERYRRVDVIIYSDRENPWVSVGAGAVSLEQEVFGRGSAEERGRAPGNQATNSFRAAQQANSTTTTGGAPDKPAEASDSQPAQIRTEPLVPSSILAADTPPRPEIGDEPPPLGQDAEDRGREGEAEQSPLKPETPGQQALAEARETSFDGAAMDEKETPESQLGIPTVTENQEAEAEQETADDRPNGANPPEGTEAPDETAPSALHPLMDLQMASLTQSTIERMRADRDMPTDVGPAISESAESEPIEVASETTREGDDTESDESSEGAAVEAEEAEQIEMVGETTREGDDTESDEALDGAVSGLEKAEPIEVVGETTREWDDAEPAEASDKTASEMEETGPTEVTSDTAHETDDAALVDKPSVVTSEAEETREASAERPAEGAGVGVGVLIELAASASEKVHLLTTTAAEEATAAEGVDAEAADRRETLDGLEAASPIVLASISPAAGTPQLSQIPSTAVGMKLLLRTMPGLDQDLSEAIAHPEAPIAFPPSERRQQVLERMEAAAERGYAHAQFGVARRQLIGHGTPRDPFKAGEWLMQAAQQGHTKSQLALGYLAARGYGVEHDLSESMLWWTLAGEAGNVTAARAAEMLEPHLSPEELIRARREVSGWRASLGTTIPDPNIGGDETPTTAPLQEAIAAGDLAAVHSLLARGEDADGRDIDGRTALINAGWRGNRRIASTLIEVGADPDVADNEGKTALIWAAGNGHLRVVEQLAAAGTELDIQDDKGLTALMRATWNGYTDVVEALVEAGADRGLRDRANMSALDYAKRQEYDDIVAILEGGS